MARTLRRCIAEQIGYSQRKRRRDRINKYGGTIVPKLGGISKTSLQYIYFFQPPIMLDTDGRLRGRTLRHFLPNGFDVRTIQITSTVPSPAPDWR